MTALTETQPSLWDTSDRDRPSRPACALCAKAPASPFGLCRSCLEQAAAELARITPRGADPDDPRPSAVNVRDLCGRCGGWNHRRTECDT